MRRITVVLALAVLMAGCATAPPERGQDARQAAFAAHEASVGSLDRWTLYARAAINTPQDSGTVSLFWRQRGRSYTLTLRAPLGAGTVRLSGDGQSATLRTSDGTRDQATSAARLVQRHTGYVLPVEYLRYWVRGIPAPGERQAMALTPQGYLRTLTQAGWRLRFDDYRKTGGVSLPGTIKARGQGIELKLAVQQWDAVVGAMN